MTSRWSAGRPSAGETLPFPGGHDRLAAAALEREPARARARHRHGTARGGRVADRARARPRVDTRAAHWVLAGIAGIDPLAAAPARRSGRGGSCTATGAGTSSTRAAGRRRARLAGFVPHHRSAPWADPPPRARGEAGRCSTSSTRGSSRGRRRARRPRPSSKTRTRCARRGRATTRRRRPRRGAADDHARRLADVELVLGGGHAHRVGAQLDGVLLRGRGRVRHDANGGHRRRGRDRRSRARRPRERIAPARAAHRSALAPPPAWT